MHYLTANESLSKINLSVNQEYGYLSFSLGKLLSLPPIVMTKVIQLFAAHIGGARRSLSRNTTFARFHRKVLSRDRKVAVFDNCLAFFPDLDNDTVIIGRAPPKPAEQVWTPISVGQTVHWDKRWRVTLKQLEKLDGQDSDEEAPDRLVHNEEQLYVSHMEIGEYWGEYWGENKQDKRLVPASILPDNKLWSGLPVVCTESGHVVVAPHFKIIDHSYGVDCDVTFDPSLPLIQYLDTNVY